MNILNPHVPQRQLISRYLRILSNYYLACYKAFSNRNTYCLNRELELSAAFSTFAERQTFDEPLVVDIIETKTYLRTNRIQKLLEVIHKSNR